MKTTAHCLLPLLTGILVGCGSPQSRSEGRADVHDTTTTPTSVALESDSSSLAKFIDTLRSDLARGSLSFLLSRRINEKGFLHCDDSSNCEYLNDPEYAAATARLLAWHLKYGAFELDTSAERKGFAQAPVYPIVVNGREKDFRVFVGDINAPLFGGVGVDSLRPIGVPWVRKLAEKGGVELKGYPQGKIEQDWLQIETPDGIKGWVRGESVRDIDGPFLSLAFWHLPTGWKVESMHGEDDPEDTEPRDP